MNRETSMRISAKIGAAIAGGASAIRYTANDLRRAERAYGADALAEMREIGLLGDDFELFYVVREFWESLTLGDEADGAYLLELFRNAKKFDAPSFMSNPYLAAVRANDARMDNILLTTASYGRGEIFQYDMPDFSAEIVVPKLGFFTETVHFPALYEDATPWMSVCPSEIYSMREPIRAAHGKVLVLGLGLGYYPFCVSLMPEVTCITIVECRREIIDLFRSFLLPQFPHRDKIRIVKDDALHYLSTVRDGDFDFCFADIWEGVIDGADAYRKINPYEARLPSTEFAYWIEAQIRAYLDI